MVMLHSHVAQSLFANVLTLSALAMVALRPLRERALWTTVKAHRSSLFASFGIGSIFFLPIAIEYLVHNPNNVTKIAIYLAKHRGEHNSVLAVFLYFASFLTYSDKADVIIGTQGAALTDLFRTDAYIRVYWTVFVLLGTAAVALTIATRRTVPLFIKLTGACAVEVSLLFLYWSWRITGPMYTFNGFFFFALQLFILMAFALLIAEAVGSRIDSRVAGAIGCALATQIALLGPLIHSNFGSNPAVLSIVKRVKMAGITNVMMTFKERRDPFLVGAGVASYLQRNEVTFCVPLDWEFVFGAARVCRGAVAYRLDIDDENADCQPPCTVIHRTKELSVSLVPRPALLRMPVTFAANDVVLDKWRFNEAEGTASWSKKTSEIHFGLVKPGRSMAPYTLELIGTALPGRAAQFYLNGNGVGRIDQPGRTRQTFELNPSWIVWDGENVLRVEVPAAGPVGADSRELGYLFEEATIAGLFGDGHTRARVTQLPEDASGAMISAISWTPSGHWQLNGQYPEIGAPRQGAVWGSWSGSDAFTGKLVSSDFPSPSGCLVIPAGHGPSTNNQRLSIVASSGESIADVTLDQSDGKWRYYKIRHDRAAKQVRIVAEDGGGEFGQWMAIGQPRLCGPGK
jgi:hypothetical protein